MCVCLVENIREKMCGVSKSITNSPSAIQTHIFHVIYMFISLFEGESSKYFKYSLRLIISHKIVYLPTKFCTFLFASLNDDWYFDGQKIKCAAIISYYIVECVPCYRQKLYAKHLGNIYAKLSIILLRTRENFLFSLPGLPFNLFQTCVHFLLIFVMKLNHFCSLNESHINYENYTLSAGKQIGLFSRCFQCGCRGRRSTIRI